jgi:biopolymer transport protein ExbD
MGMTGPSGDDDSPMMDINTTPLIDVMLVLLIMFIITLPKPTDAVKIDLPTECVLPNGDPCPKPDVPDPVKNVIYIAPNSAVTWNGETVSERMLYDNLKLTLTMKPQPVLVFQPDAQAPYQKVNKILAVTRASGVENIGFVGNELYISEF